MDQQLQQKADRRFESALKASGARDPREFYRECLRGLKASDMEAYGRAVRYYEDVLVPSVASEEGDPIDAWREYGKYIAEQTAPGRTLEIDDGGRARPYQPPTPVDRLVLHVPDGRVTRAILVALPQQPSPAQMATYDLLVRGKQKLREPDVR